jgi:hypothetical protein
MRPKVRLIVALLAVAIVAGAAVTVHSAGQTTAQPGWTGVVDRLMSQIGTGKIDDALATIDFLKDQPDARAALRERLIEITNAQQQRYYGYDVAAVQRFTDRLQTVSVLAYYGEQPLIFRFEFYRPQQREDQPWVIQSLSLHPNVTEELKDVPVDYFGHRTGTIR